MWYLNGMTLIGGAFGPNQPAGWQGIAAADFNGDGHPDLLLWNPTTRQTAIWYLNGVQFLSGVFGPTLPAGWAPVLVDDFNRDGQPDMVLFNQSTRRTAIWRLNNNVFVSGVLVRPSPLAGFWSGRGRTATFYFGLLFLVSPGRRAGAGSPELCGKLTDCRTAPIRPDRLEARVRRRC